MKLLIVTQKLDKNDENLGAFYFWFERLAQKCERMIIIADVVGAHDLPSHVEVFSLGKESDRGRVSRLWRYWSLFSYHYARSDIVLFHMIPEFVLAAAPFLLSLKRRRFLWYAHGTVTWRLVWAERLVDFVLSSSPAGFRLPSKKVIFIGQAVNAELFRPVASAYKSFVLSIVTIGRIAPVKDYETILRACNILKNSWERDFLLSIIGGPILPRDHVYMKTLERLVQELGLSAHVHFYGPRPFGEIPALLQSQDMFINLSRTGSLDKAVLEAMSTGLTVITANDAYQSFLPGDYFLTRVSPEALAGRIRALADEKRPNMALREIVMRDHSLDKTMEKIIKVFQEPL